MITPPNGVRILMAAQPVDFRKGIDSLAALVQQVLALDPFAGDLFIFRAKRADRVKIPRLRACVARKAIRDSRRKAIRDSGAKQFGILVA